MNFAFCILNLAFCVMMYQNEHFMVAILNGFAAGFTIRGWLEELKRGTEENDI